MPKPTDVPNKEIADRVVSILKDMIESDREALRLLVQHRVPCSRELTDHPTIQVGQQEQGRGYLETSYEVGLLGILNGIIGADIDGLGFVAIIQEDDGTITDACLVPGREFNRG